MADVSVKKKRTRKSMPEAESKRRRDQREANFHKSRIYLGSEQNRWAAIKKEMNFKTDREVATFLIDRYKHTSANSTTMSVNHVSTETVELPQGEACMAVSPAVSGLKSEISPHCSDDIDQQVEVKVERVDGAETTNVGSYRTVKVEVTDEVDKDVSDNTEDDTAQDNRGVEKKSDQSKHNGRLMDNSRKSNRACTRGVRPNYARMALEDESDDDDDDDDDDDEESELDFDDSLSDKEIENKCEDSIKPWMQLKVKEEIVDKSYETHDSNTLKNQQIIRKDQAKRKKEDPDFVISGEEIESFSENTDDENSDSSQDGQVKRKKVKIYPSKKRMAKSWIKIRLEDHQDTYKVENVGSFERKNRNCDQKEEMFSCLLCGRYKSSTRNIFEEHIELHVNKALECDKCDFVTYSEVILMRHRHSFGHQADNPSTRYKRREYMCDLCGVIVYSRESKLVHLGSKHNNPQFKCQFCDEKFITTKRRLGHAISVHSDQFKYCYSCERSFKSMSDDAFQQHKESCKPSNVSQCQLCGRDFANKSRLNKHIQLTHMNVRKHQCHLCQYAAKNITNLKQHLMAHNNVHPYNCDQCTFTCVQRYQLTSHMRTHSGEKPFKCMKCKFAAAWNVQLKTFANS